MHGFLLGLLFYPEDAGVIFLRKSLTFTGLHGVISQETELFNKVTGYWLDGWCSIPYMEFSQVFCSSSKRPEFSRVYPPPHPKGRAVVLSRGKAKAYFSVEV
jgi:hypothetical protein